MQTFDPPDPEFESRTRSSFALQQLMTTMGARMTKVVPGEVSIELPFNSAWTQQNDFIHAGIITSIVDSACGYAAYTLMPANSGILTVEYKVNFLNPAKGERFIAVGRVIKPGRSNDDGAFILTSENRHCVVINYECQPSIRKQCE
jgi:uncharacterized protein (TIGR00369 family)